MQPFFFVTRLSVHHVGKLLYLCLFIVVNASFTTVHASPAGYQDDDITQGSLVYFQQGQVIQALALDTQVSMKVSGLLNRVTVKQVFINDSDLWVNGRYLFPLPETAAVDSMALRIGDKVISGQIQPKKQALHTFETAKKQGKQASLLQQQRRNLFISEVANLAPHGQLVVEISYQQKIEYSDGVFSLRFPLAITPRYNPQDNHGAEPLAQPASHIEAMPVVQAQPELMANTQINTQIDTQVNMQVSIDAGFELTSLSSLYHPIKQSNKDHLYSVSFAGKQIADRDFVLQWQANVGALPQAATFYQTGKTHDEADVKSYFEINKVNGTDPLQGQSHPVDNSLYSLVMLMPPSVEVSEQHLIARELILVIDTSGSMSGQSITQAKQALPFALAGLRDIDTFNIIEFNSDVSMLSATPLPANSRNIDRAKRFIYALEADGGTEMRSALQTALVDSVQQDSDQTDIRSNMLRQVIFMTDGAVGNEHELYQLINDQLGDSRLFTVGIGSAPNSDFMRRAATMGRGTFTYIGDESEVQQKIEQLLNKIEQPVLTNIGLHYLDGSVPDYWPTTISDLYQNEPIWVSIKSASHQQQPIIVSGNINGQYWQQQLDFEDNQAAKGIDLLWANAQITSLELYKDNASRDRVNKQVEALGILYHLVTSQTSLVAVDVTPVNPLIDSPIDVKLQPHMPHGLQAAPSSSQVLPQTGTSSRLWLLIGFSMLSLGLLHYLWLRQCLPGQLLVIESNE